MSTNTADGANPSRGRLYGRSVLDGVFRAGPDEDLFLGELLIATDERTKRRYIYRVVDIGYGSDHREPGWAERVAGTLLADDAAGRSGEHVLHDLTRRTYRVAECKCLGYIAAPFESGSSKAAPVFRKPKSLPTQFSRVDHPTTADLAFLEQKMGDLPIGRLRSGEAVLDITVGLHSQRLASHVGVFATTGMGKSNLVRVLAASVMKSNRPVGMMIIDPHGEFATELGRHPYAEERLRVFAARDTGFASSLRLSLGELSLEDMQTAYSWSAPQVEALYELERHYGQSDLRWLAQFAQVEQLAEFRDVELAKRVALSTLQVVHRRARRLVALPCIGLDPVVSVGKSVLDELRRGSVVVIDASGLQSTEELLIASHLSRRVLDTWQDSFVNRRDEHARLPVVLIVLEEAQRVLARTRDGDVNVFPRIAREGRKFKVGLCAVSQQPRLIDDELLSQLSTFFILGLGDEKDRTVLRGAAKKDVSDLGPEIQTLMEGECLLVNLDTPFAVPTLIDHYDAVVANTAPPPRLARDRHAPANVAGLVD